MIKVKQTISVAVVGLSLLALIPALSRADGIAKEGTMMMSPNGMTAQNNVPVAISGYCTVCLLSGMKNKGSDNFTTEYNGKLYKFGSIGMQKAFVDDPEKYTKDVEARFAAMSK